MSYVNSHHITTVPPHDHLEICGHQDSASGLEPHDIHSVMNSPDIITVSIYFLVTKLHIM